MLFWEKRWQVSSQNQIWTLWLLWSWNFASWTSKTFRFLTSHLLFPKSPALTTLFTTLPSSTLETGIKSSWKSAVRKKYSPFCYLFPLSSCMDGLVFKSYIFPLDCDSDVIVMLSFSFKCLSWLLQREKLTVTFLLSSVLMNSNWGIIHNFVYV